MYQPLPANRDIIEISLVSVSKAELELRVILVLHGAAETNQSEQVCVKL